MWAHIYPGIYTYMSYTLNPIYMDVHFFSMGMFCETLMETGTSRVGINFEASTRLFWGEFPNIRATFQGKCRGSLGISGV